MGISSGCFYCTEEKLCSTKDPSKLERKLDHIYIGDMKLFVHVPEYGKTSNKKLGGEETKMIKKING
ncbi:hypothetical protein CR513_19569, partial [Mucuna pruriens]